MTSSEEPQNERVLPPDDLNDDKALKDYGRQLAMDSLLSELRPAEDAPNVVTLPKQNWTRRAWISASAASVAGLAGIAVWKLKKGETLALLDPRWVLHAASDAEFQILSPSHVKLLRGELRFASRKPAELQVETPNGNATAHGTEFLIGHHDSTNPNHKKTGMKINTVTRLLVLAGSVTLANAKGAEKANSDEAIVAKTNESPEKILVDANTKFAFDCYSALAEADGDANLFFSPYSISSALLMVAEGARGETAQEMGEALGFSDSLKREGDDAQFITWEMSKLRTGQTQLDKLLGIGGDVPPEQVELKEKEVRLMKQWDELKAKIAKGGLDKKAMFRLRDDERLVIWNLNQARKKMDTLSLNIANAVWGDKTMRFHEPWKKTVSGTYGVGAVEEADFVNDHEAERARINAWVERQTEGRITDLFQEGSINEITRLVLANAIYFKGDWLEPFPERGTKEADFNLSSGETSKASLMSKSKDETVRYAAFNADGSAFETPEWDRGEGKPMYPGKDGFSMVEIPYRGGALSMVVIAPNDPAGLPVIEKQLDSTNVSKWIASLKNRKTNVRLPKFKLETSYNLKETLAALGMPTAFDEATADFTGVSESKDIVLGAVMHKAFIEVNEKGTEAAAATGVAWMKNSIEPFTPTFSADRPFVYLIRDKQSGTVLFLGRVMDPTA